jgi:hypothetical protein
MCWLQVCFSVDIVKLVASIATVSAKVLAFDIHLAANRQLEVVALFDFFEG